MSSSRKYWVMAARNSEALLYTDLVSEQLPYTVSLCRHKTQISVISLSIPTHVNSSSLFPSHDAKLFKYLQNRSQDKSPTTASCFPKFNKTVGIFPIHLFFCGGRGVIVFTNNSTHPFQTLLFKKSRYFADKYIFILTWQERHHDHEGGLPRARLIHFTLDVLTLRFPQMQETRLITCSTRGLPSHSRLKEKRKRKLIYIFSTKISPHSQTTAHLHDEPRSHLWAKANLASLLFLHCYYLFEDKGCLYFCSSMYLLFDVRLRTYLHRHSFT